LGRGQQTRCNQEIAQSDVKQASKSRQDTMMRDQDMHGCVIRTREDNEEKKDFIFNVNKEKEISTVT